MFFVMSIKGIWNLVVGKEVGLGVPFLWIMGYDISLLREGGHSSLLPTSECARILAYSTAPR